MRGAVRGVALVCCLARLRVARAYTTIAAAATHAEIVKKSRFVAHAAPVGTERAALAFVADLSDPKASHNCYAYRLADGSERCSGDGEPGGTAGPPILSAIAGLDLLDVAVLVTRYYGGIKLGTGGLVRAYGGAASTCLRACETIQCVPHTILRVEFSHADTGAVFGVLGALQPTPLGARHLPCRPHARRAPRPTVRRAAQVTRAPRSPFPRRLATSTRSSARSQTRRRGGRAWCASHDGHCTPGGCSAARVRRKRARLPVHGWSCLAALSWHAALTTLSTRREGVARAVCGWPLGSALHISSSSSAYQIRCARLCDRDAPGARPDNFAPAGRLSRHVSRRCTSALLRSARVRSFVGETKFPA